MKTRKLFLPIAAVAFAAAGAFASDFMYGSIANDPVVIDGDTECTQVGRCTNMQDQSSCKNSSNQQLDIRQSLTSCNVPAKGTFTPAP